MDDVVLPVRLELIRLIGAKDVAKAFDDRFDRLTKEIGRERFSR